MVRPWQAVRAVERGKEEQLKGHRASTRLCCHIRKSSEAILAAQHVVWTRFQVNVAIQIAKECHAAFMCWKCRSCCSPCLPTRRDQVPSLCTELYSYSLCYLRSSGFRKPWSYPYRFMKLHFEDYLLCRRKSKSSAFDMAAKLHSHAWQH